MFVFFWNGIVNIPSALKMFVLTTYNTIQCFCLITDFVPFIILA